MFNKNVMNIAKFDFLNTLKSKGFIILNVVLCILVIIAINLTSIINLFKSSGIIKSSDYILEVYDVDGKVYEALKESYDTNQIIEVKRQENKVGYIFENIPEDVIAVNVEQTGNNFYDNVEVIIIYGTIDIGFILLFNILKLNTLFNKFIAFPYF